METRNNRSGERQRAVGLVALVGLALFLRAGGSLAFAHDAGPVTHSFDRGVAGPGPRLVLSVTEPVTGRFLAARFAVRVDGRDIVPPWVDEHGIRFRSIHRGKKEEFTTLYARGTGPVTIGLPVDARNVEVIASRGFEYLPTSAAARVDRGRVALGIALRRWSNLSDRGWIAVDEHVHFDRLEPGSDATWLTILEADGLTAGHFMVLKGGNLPGVWARQFAFGAEGQATDGARMIVPGQEYRDTAQGHLNLLGIDRILEPISTGGLGTPAILENFPPFHDVLQQARAAHALAGVAHGGTLGQSSTAIADALLGTVDFWEISNGPIYSTETWYRLMNCGTFLPPAAGTDLPNFSGRDGWQPMLGAVRTYVHTEGRIDFESFKDAMARGRVFVTGGPLIDLTINGKSSGETVELPAGGGTVSLRAELSSPGSLRDFRVVHNGRDVPLAATSAASGEIRRQVVEGEITIRESGWLAAWGKGQPIAAQQIDAMAHTGAVRVRVGRRPVRVRHDLEHFVTVLEGQRDHYLAKGRYRRESDRQQAVRIFERAIDELRRRMSE